MARIVKRDQKPAPQDNDDSPGRRSPGSSLKTSLSPRRRPVTWLHWDL
jgi:hypothetical protein